MQWESSLRAAGSHEGRLLLWLLLLLRRRTLALRLTLSGLLSFRESLPDRRRRRVGIGADTRVRRDGRRPAGVAGGRRGRLLLLRREAERLLRGAVGL